MLSGGGADQVRTDDLLNAIEALFQLSYEPVTNVRAAKNRERLVNASGFFGNSRNAVFLHAGTWVSRSKFYLQKRANALPEGMSECHLGP